MNFYYFLFLIALAPTALREHKCLQSCNKINSQIVPELHSKQVSLPQDKVCKLCGIETGSKTSNKLLSKITGQTLTNSSHLRNGSLINHKNYSLSMRYRQNETQLVSWSREEGGGGGETRSKIEQTVIEL